MTKNKLLLLLVLLAAVATGAMAQDYYAPSTDEVIILNEVYNASNSGYSSHSAIAWGGSASPSKKNAGDPNNGGQQTSSTVNCYSVKGTGQGKNITLSITGVSTVIVYHEKKPGRYIELRDGSKGGNIIGSGEKNTNVTEVALTATNKYSIFLHGTSNGSDDQDLYVYAIKLIAAPAAAATGYSVTLAEGTEDANKWTVKVGEEAAAFPVGGLKGGEKITLTYNGSREVKSVTAVKKAAVDNTYLEWDPDKKQLVATAMPTTYKTVESANDGATWEAGTYVVEGDVTIGGMLTLNGDVDLIIKDGATLTAQKIMGENNKLYIYGQAQMTGELVVNCSNGDAIRELSTLAVLSAKVTATSSLGSSGGIGEIEEFDVYGGSVDAKNTGSKGYGICLVDDGIMNIYGGEVKAEGKGDGDWGYGIVCGNTKFPAFVFVYGGKLWAGNADNKALNAVNLLKGDGFTGKIEYSSDNSTWSETKDAAAKYVRVGY